MANRWRLTGQLPFGRTTEAPATERPQRSHRHHTRIYPPPPAEDAGKPVDKAQSLHFALVLFRIVNLARTMPPPPPRCPQCQGTRFVDTTIMPNYAPLAQWAQAP